MDIDIDSIRKRDQWARAVGTRAYSEVARNDYAGTSYQFNRASAQDALADRNWLLSEVDRLSAEVNAKTFILEKRNEQADQWRRERDSARAEVEKLRDMRERDAYIAHLKRAIATAVQNTEHDEAEIRTLRALVEQCRPVVEAVMRVKDAKGLGALHKALLSLRKVPLPTMPEVKP